MAANADSALFLPKNAAFSVGAQVSTARLVRALDLIARSTTTALAERVWWMAKTTTAFAIEETKRLEPAVIDENLDASVVYYTNAKMNRRSRAKWTKFKRAEINPWRSRPVPLGVLVVMARHDMNSRWNRLTDHRWALPNALPTGKGTAQARQAQIGAELARMISSRHSSTGFLKRGFAHAYRQLKKLRPRRERLGGGFIDVEATVEQFGDDGQTKLLGFATGSGLGTSDKPWIKVENAVGMEGTPNLSARRQAWLFAVGGPALERAIARAIADSRTHYLDRALSDDLVREWKEL